MNLHRRFSEDAEFRIDFIDDETNDGWVIAVKFVGTFLKRDLRISIQNVGYVDNEEGKKEMGEERLPLQNVGYVDNQEGKKEMGEDRVANEYYIIFICNNGVSYIDLCDNNYYYYYSLQM